MTKFKIDAQCKEHEQIQRETKRNGEWERGRWRDRDVSL